MNLAAVTARLKKLWPVTIKGRDRLRIGLILGGATLAGYLVTCVAYPAPLIARDREVARVLGLPLPEAEKELSEQGFKAKVDGEDTDPVIPAGHIIWQDPPPEMSLPSGTTVHLTVSSGPATVSVPDVISFDLDQARQVMEAAGLRIGDVDSIASPLDAGLVVATRPPTGGTKTPGSTVEIVVSRGPADIRVPDVVGLKQEEARTRLEAAGLKVGLVTTRAGKRNPAGIVLEQRPTAGVLSPRDSRINLVISK